MTGEGLGIGLAGLGVHGLRYASHLLAGDVPRARLVAVHRRDADRGRAFADEHGVRYRASVSELLADDGVDALVAALPPAAHPPAVLAARRAGKPLLVEKPLGPDAASARAAAEAAEGDGPPVMVAQTLRFDAVVRALQGALPSIGRIHLVAIDHRFEPSGRAWLDDPAEGGLLLNTGVHGADLLRHLTGAEVVEARALGRSVVLERVIDVFASVLRLEPGGILATLDNSRATAGRTGRIEVVGEHGQLLADHVHRTLVRVEGRTATALPLPEPVPTVREALRAFVSAVLDGGPVPVTAADGLRAVEAIEKIRAALAEEAS